MQRIISVVAFVCIIFGVICGLSAYYNDGDIPLAIFFFCLLAFGSSTFLLGMCFLRLRAFRFWANIELVDFMEWRAMIWTLALLPIPAVLYLKTGSLEIAGCSILGTIIGGIVSNPNSEASEETSVLKPIREDSDSGIYQIKKAQ